MPKLKIEGMSCGHCATTVKSALERVPGVAEARVRLEEGTADVLGDVDLHELVAAVEAEGYGASAASS